MVLDDKLSIKWTDEPTDPAILEKLIKTCKCKQVDIDKLTNKKWSHVVVAVSAYHA